MKQLITAVIVLLSSTCQALTISQGQTYANSGTLYDDEIVLGPNSTFINEGCLYIDCLDLSRCYQSGANFVNTGVIYCNSVDMNVNQWQWLPEIFTFSSQGAIVCETDINLMITARTNLSLGENSVITCQNLNVDKYGNQDIDFMGTINADRMTVTVNDGGKIVRFGDLIVTDLILRNNATNISVDGFAYIEHLNSATWGNANITVDGGMVIGDIDSHSNVIGTQDSFISLCTNPTDGQDFRLQSSGTVIYRVKNDDTDSYYWSRTPVEENEVHGGAVCKANRISYQSCITGEMDLLFIKDDRMIEASDKKDPKSGLRVLKSGPLELYVKDNRLIFFE